MKTQMLKFIKSTKTTWISLALVVLVITGLQISVWGKFSDPDGFYHAKASQLLLEGKLGDTFPWLAYTTWSEGYADQHYLYHWLLVPFNTVGLLPVSIILFSTIFFVCFWLLMSKMQVPGKPFWLLLTLLGSVDFIFRINVVKANTISLALLCLITLITYQYHQQKNKKLLALIGVLSGIFAWTYGGFVCVPLFLTAYSMAILISERKVDVWPLLSSIFGIVVALLIHPHSQNLLVLLYDQIFQTGLGAGRVVPAGNEWLPFRFDWFLESNILVLTGWLIALVVEAKKIFSRKLNWLSIWMQTIAIGFFVLTLWHRRFIEYWTPFTVLATAITLSPYVRQLSWGKCKSLMVSAWQVTVAGMLIVVIVVLIGFYNVQKVYLSLSSGEANNRYQNASNWLINNSTPKDLVLNTQWDQSAQLFYWNDKNYYMLGLDPTFMYIYNPNLYWDWRKIADDNVENWGSIEAVHKLVKQDLRAKFIFVDVARNPNIYNFLSNDVHSDFFELGFDAGGLAIFRVL